MKLPFKGMGGIPPNYGNFRNDLLLLSIIGFTNMSDYWLDSSPKTFLVDKCYTHNPLVRMSP